LIFTFICTFTTTFIFACITPVQGIVFIFVSVISGFLNLYFLCVSSVLRLGAVGHLPGQHVTNNHP
ncbi:hypothetical protein L9F63_022234, partial [Diploptera punctata]